MFQQKIQNINEQRKKYLIDSSEYHYLIEALLFKLQKTNQGKIEYVSNGINRIDIYIVKNQNLKEIRLPYFDKDFQIWKNKLYTIDELKMSKPKQIIDQYNIKIHEVEEFENQNSQELKALKQENQKLKSINEQLQEENQKLKSINEQLQEEINKKSTEKEESDFDVTFDDDSIIHDDPIILQVNDQQYHITLDQIFAQNFNLKIGNNNIKIKPHFESDYVTYENKNIYYNFVYLKQYANYLATPPEPFDQKYQIKLIDGAEFHAIKKQNYNVYIRVKLQ